MSNQNIPENERNFLDKLIIMVRLLRSLSEHYHKLEEQNRSNYENFNKNSQTYSVTDLEDALKYKRDNPIIYKKNLIIESIFKTLYDNIRELLKGKEDKKINLASLNLIVLSVNNINYSVLGSDSDVDKYKKEILVDFVSFNIDEYRHRAFNQKDLSKLFDFSEKKVSSILCDNDLSTSHRLSDKEKFDIVNYYNIGYSISETAKIMGINRSTVSNYYSKFKKNIDKRNAKDPIDIPHHDIISKLIEQIPKKDSFIIYSEHIDGYRKRKILDNVQYSHIFENCDLIVFRDHIPFIYVEVEINNDVEKSLLNLNKYYKECAYKILYTTEEKWEEANSFKKNMNIPENIRILKIVQNFEKDFKSDIRSFIKKSPDTK